MRLICHVSKEAARSGALDQSASRGGSALADGARMVTVLRSFDPAATDDKLIPPPGLSFGTDEPVIVLARPKLSYTPPQPLIWITRRGYAFRHVAATRPDLEAEAKARPTSLSGFSSRGLAAGLHYTRNTLNDTGVIKPRDKLRAALSALEAAGRVVDAPNPTTAHARGGARTYLHPVAFASPKHDGEATGNAGQK